MSGKPVVAAVLAAQPGMVQQKCCACEAPLEAYSRIPNEHWTCPGCNVAGATCAEKAEAPN